MNIILCGYKSCGKTTIGKAYAEQFNFSFVDIDELILTNNITNTPYATNETDAKPSVRALYNKIGENKFRELEAIVVEELVAKIRHAGDTNTIIATGGGVVLNPANIISLKSIGKIVYLKVNKDILHQRLATLQDISKPQFLQNTSSYLESRNALYENYADYVVDASELKILEIAEIINQTMKSAVEIYG